MYNGGDREVAFVGKITAGITHEIRNVLAIIKESAGLLEDLLALSPEDLISYQGKSENTLANIKSQVQRGVALTDRLNKFAHSPDKHKAKIDLHEITQQTIDLSRRFARLKNVVVEIEPAPEPLRIVTHVIQLQMALFKCIECCLNAMPHGGQIKFYPHKRVENNIVQISCHGDLPAKAAFIKLISNSKEWIELQEIAFYLGGSTEADASVHGILFFLPDDMDRKVIE